MSEPLPTPPAEPGTPPATVQRRVLRRILSYVRPYRARLGLAVVLVLPEALLGLLIPYFLGVVINAALAAKELGGLNQSALAFLGVVLLQALFMFSREYLMSTVAERVVADIRAAVHAHVLTLPLGFFHRSRTGEILSGAANDVTQLQRTLATAPGQLVRMPITVLGGITLMFLTSTWLTVAMLAAIPPLMIAATLFGNVVAKWSRTAQDELGVATASFQEGIAGVETVKAFGAEPFETARYRTLISRTFDAYRRKAWIESWFGALATFTLFSALVGLFWLGGRMVIQGSLEPGQLMALLGYTLYVQGAVGSLTQLWTEAQSTLGATGRVFDLLDESPEPGALQARSASALPLPASSLSFEDVSFRYPGREEEALRGITLRLRQGEVCALVGSSGSGKSTVARLLFRFFEPTGGRILLEGTPLSDIPLERLRATLGLVSQEPVLFSGTLRDNIRYGRPEASDVEVEAAARAAHADGFIRALEQGYDTPVGERGVTLSGGQRQRIAIARALLRDPRVLVLDEATSALDSESERQVQQALDVLLRGRTTLIIAHRLSTIRGADRIIVLDQGRIVEEGRHEELLRAGGIYAHLAQLQGEASAASAFAPVQETGNVG
nr:ABC transporter permease [Corallococcus coralloides]